jgi:hypothetical protein
MNIDPLLTSDYILRIVWIFAGLIIWVPLDILTVAFIFASLRLPLKYVLSALDVGMALGYLIAFFVSWSGGPTLLSWLLAFGCYLFIWTAVHHWPKDDDDAKRRRRQSIREKIVMRLSGRLGVNPI